MNQFYLIKFQELIPILQAAIGPVILISGVGLLLLSMTNRLGRVIDRSRGLADALRHAPPEERKRYAGQIQILSQRAHLERLAITLATLSVLMAAILIISLFIAAFFHWEIVLFTSLLFIACLLFLISSLIFFIRDVNLSLEALNLELNSLK